MHDGNSCDLKMKAISPCVASTYSAKPTLKAMMFQRKLFGLDNQESAVMLCHCRLCDGTSSNFLMSSSALLPEFLSLLLTDT